MVKMKENKLVVLGAGGVGKTSLVVQFVNGFFSYNYNPTVEDCYRHIVQLPDGMFHTVEILDTAGTHQFPAMRELSIKSGQAFVVVFSVDNEESFQEAITLRDQINQIKGGEMVPIVLVGNKLDLSKEREVPAEFASATARQIINCAYIETSAKQNINVHTLFTELLMRTYGIDYKQEVIVAHRSRRYSRRLSLRSLGRKGSIDSKSSEFSDITPKCTIL